MIQRRRFLSGSAAAAGAALALTPAAAPAAPRADLWDRWTRHDPAGADGVDHAAWDGLLRQHLHPAPDGINRFAYAAVSAADRAVLDGYLAGLAATPVDALNRGEQFAYWVNLYNALTIAVVLDHYPVASIRDIDISPGLFSNGPWRARLITVAGEDLSLDDVEHRILRPIWRDPRIHYAVNCAALGCPNLQPEAFTAANTERLLEAGATAFVNHPRGARVAQRRLTVSSIYEWFSEDFGGDDAGVITHLRRYANGSLAIALAGIRRVAGDDYDWSLNDATGSTG